MTPRTARPGVRGLRTLLVLLLLFLAAWGPRVLGLDAFVTADEPGWLFRSANFYQAIAHRDLANTMQLEHPGVTVTWAGTLAFLQRLPGYAVRNPGQLTEGQLEPWLRTNTTLKPLDLLIAGRRWIVLWVALLTTVSYFPLRKLWGASLAVLAVLMLAWDPFLIALTRELHMDGLLAYLCIVALLAFLAWLHGGRQWRYLFVSAVMTGLALLSKSTTLVLIALRRSAPLSQRDGEAVGPRFGLRYLDPARGCHRDRSLAGAVGRTGQGPGYGDVWPPCPCRGP
jgi:hypothetical protein